MSYLEQHLVEWRPAPWTQYDTISAEQVAALSAVLDQPATAADGDPLPPLWHWLYFLEWPAEADLGADGHPNTGHFLPPIPDRRRMFAGGRLQIQRPLTIGQQTTRVSSLANSVVKQGRSGELAFVTIRSELCQSGETRAVEELDFVYRSGAGASPSFSRTPAPAPPSTAAWQLRPRISPMTLFRFSALTANAHRIHYDAPYAHETEGYPGLVVHGPLLAVLMLELVRCNDPRAVAAISFRLRRPVFLGDGILVHGGRDGGLVVATAADDSHATAEVRFR
ncbi:hypothetical protein ACFYXQ_32630 [Nocardia jiangxiensis]|uniref:3-methylfumaryl-CoA hydratase n=1 Tax=Nocardia jiangxiensis TaxID=282685 RepID=A0ABW6SAV3_9NOCA